MKTLVISIREAVAASEGYQVELFFDNGAPAWWTQPISTGVLPKTLTLDEGAFTALGKPLPSRPTLEKMPDPKAAPAEEFEAIGEYIYQLLDTSEIGKTWRELRKLYPREQHPHSEGLRTIFDIRPAELQSVPWELIRENAWRAFADAKNPASLGTIDFTTPTPPIEWPIRVLVVVGCAADDSAVEWRKELQDVETALRKLRHAVDYEVIRHPSSDTLIARYTEFRPHIFHFIGHGVLDAGSKRPALEIWDGATSTTYPWNAGDIRSVLSVHAPRFAFLNACRSSTEDAVGWDLARAFLDAGAVAVLGMRGDVQGKAAATIASGVYSDLARGHQLDLALARARVDVSMIADIKQHWMLPRLVLAVPPERGFALDLGLSEEERQQIFEAADFHDVHDFVDRKHERRSLWQNVEPTSRRNLTVVVGNDQVGKTALLLWCLQGVALRGRRTRYVDLNGLEPHGFLSILHLIHGDPNDHSSLIRRPLPEPAFQRFLFELDYMLEDKEPPVSAQPPAAPSHNKRKCLQPGAENAIPRIFQLFRDALEQAAKHEPLLLVIDHLKNAFPHEFKKYVTPHLLEPVRDGRVANVRVVLAASKGDFDALDLGRLVGPRTSSLHVINVHPFKPDEFIELACEFCGYHNVEDSRALVEALATMVRSDWEPHKLRTIPNFLEGWR